MSQPNPHSTDADGELPTLPIRPAPLPAGPAPVSGPLPSPLDAQHRALPAPDPLIDPLPPASHPPAIPADSPDRAGLHPIPPEPASSRAPSPAPQPPAAAQPRRPHRNPRVRAALAYALPLLPALVLLLRERRNRFVRVHAAQALIFYLLVAGWQIALFFAAVGAGAVFTDLHADVVAALAFIAAFILLGVLSLLLWLRLLADAMAGQRTLFPVLSIWAERIERVTARGSRVASESAPAPENVTVS